jgi:hypothetical protein
MPSATIKEYLVALGFKVDEPGARLFHNAIEQATKGTKTLGETAIGTATAIEFAVTKIARQFTDLYYAAQRTGASVAELQSYSFAMKQIGIDSGSASNAIEGFAQSIRTNPGLKGLLAGMGINPSDSATALPALVEKLKKRYGDNGYFIAQQIGSLYNIPEDVFFHYWKNSDEFSAAQRDFAARQKAAGIDATDLANKSVLFSRDLNRFESDIDILGERIEKDFIEPADGMLNVVDGLVRGFNNLDAELRGIPIFLGTIAGGFFAMSRAVLMARAAIKFFGRDAAATMAGEAGATAAAEAGAVGAGGAAAATGWLPWLAAVGGLGTAALLATTSGLNSGEDEMGRQRKFGAGGGSTPLGLRLNNPGNLRAWAGAPNVGGFAQFPSLGVGLAAMVKQLSLYGQRGKNTLSSIIGTWAPSNENDTAAYIADVAKKTGFGADQKLNLNDPATMQALLHAMISHEQGYDPFTDSQEAAAVKAQLGGGTYLGAGRGAPSVVLNEKTDITINGVSDPEIAARESEAAQNRVHANIVRDMAGVVR